MSYGYVRFLNSVMSPDESRTDISKARVRTSKDQTIVRPEEMAEIAIEGPMLVLRAVRQVGKRTVVLERHTPLSNVRDLEPLPEAPEPKKGNAQ